MKIKFRESQDIDILLGKRNFEKLISRESEDFFDGNTTRASSLEAVAYFYLGHCRKNMLELRAYTNELDGGVQMITPEAKSHSYYINLPPESEAVRKLKLERFYSARYPGGAKITIKIENKENKQLGLFKDEDIYSM
jgi:hypothetical protein